jgi:hypothetical protein
MAAREDRDKRGAGVKTDDHSDGEVPTAGAHVQLQLPPELVAALADRISPQKGSLDLQAIASGVTAIVLLGSAAASAWVFFRFGSAASELSVAMQTTQHEISKTDLKAMTAPHLQIVPGLTVATKKRSEDDELLIFASFSTDVLNRSSDTLVVTSSTVTVYRGEYALADDDELSANVIVALNRPPSDGPIVRWVKTDEAKYDQGSGGSAGMYYPGQRRYRFYDYIGRIPEGAWIAVSSQIVVKQQQLDPDQSRTLTTTLYCFPLAKADEPFSCDNLRTTSPTSNRSNGSAAKEDDDEAGGRAQYQEHDYDPRGKRLGP